MAPGLGRLPVQRWGLSSQRNTRSSFYEIEVLHSVYCGSLACPRDFRSIAFPSGSVPTRVCGSKWIHPSQAPAGHVIWPCPFHRVVRCGRLRRRERPRESAATPSSEWRHLQRGCDCDGERNRTQRQGDGSCPINAVPYRVGGAAPAALAARNGLRLNRLSAVDVVHVEAARRAHAIDIALQRGLSDVATGTSTANLDVKFSWHAPNVLLRSLKRICTPRERGQGDEPRPPRFRR